MFQYTSDKEILTKIIISENYKREFTKFHKQLNENERGKIIAVTEIIDPGRIEMWIHRRFLKNKTRPKGNTLLTGTDDFFKLSVADKRKILRYITFKSIMYLGLFYGIISIPILVILITLAFSATS